jgi:hypothetical protein
MKSSLHRLINFLPLFCNRQLNFSAPEFISWQAGDSELDPSLHGLNWTLLYNHSAWTTLKTQPLCCWEGVLTAPLHSNGRYSIVACVFVAVGMCLPSRCLVMNSYSDFTIPAFGCHVMLRIRDHVASSSLWCRTWNMCQDLLLQN